MPVDKTGINRWAGICLLVVVVCFAMVLLLQVVSIFVGPTKKSCTNKVCLARYLDGPPAFNDDLLAKYLRDNYFSTTSSSRYNLSGINGNDLKAFKNLQKYVLEYFDEIHPGTFAVLGAGDGEYKDLTLTLEKEHGWKGLLIEPNDALYNRLQMKGRVADLSNACVSPFAYPSKLKLTHAKVPEGASERQELEILSKTKISQLWTDEGETSTFFKQCIPLENLLYTAGLTEVIDLLVLDMSGTDLDILLNAKFEQMADIEMIIINSNGYDIGSDVGGYFLERNMVVKKMFGTVKEDIIYVLAKFDAKQDL